MEDLESTYKQKIDSEVERYEALEQGRAELNTKWDQRNNMLGTRLNHRT